MNDELRQLIIETLQRGGDLPAEWAREMFPPEKREYELVYFGKEQEGTLLSETLAVPLQPVSTFSKNGGGWQNKLVFGDNLQAMKTLVEMKARGELENADGTHGVKLIYIDPPFTTKREFVGSKDQKAYQDKIVGAQFLEFLRRRMILMRELLTPDGCIYIHLDWKKVHAVKVLADEVFGENNFVREIIWRLGWVSGYKSVAKNWIRNHETLLFYSMDPSKMFFNKTYLPYPPDYERWGGREKGKGLPIEDVWGVFPGEGVTSLQVVSFAKQDTGYPTQKPEGLLARVIEASSQPGDIVLDAFAGSGTTVAVAEKLNRKWIGIDCGKLAIYTIQKRMLNLKQPIGNSGKPLKAKPFTVYNAGLYDFSSLRQLPWQDWKFFALKLFGCREEQHSIGGLALDGKLKGSSVLVFDHLKEPGLRIDEDTIKDIHAAVGKKVSKRFFIIAPKGVFAFQQDYLDLDGVRYYALRIPYSVINELHSRDFTALQQPIDELSVNETVDAVGFDFINPPTVKWEAGTRKPQGELLAECFVKIKDFQSRARIKGAETIGGLETLSMVMVDLSYDGEVFDLDKVFYADQLESADWTVWLGTQEVSKEAMLVFLDIYGNESRQVISPEQFGSVAKEPAVAKSKK